MRETEGTCFLMQKKMGLNILSFLVNHIIEAIPKLQQKHESPEYITFPLSKMGEWLQMMQAQICKFSNHCITIQLHHLIQ